jgi:hypothetical protein
MWRLGNPVRPVGTLLPSFRWGRVHRWRPWTTTLTHLYLCDQCDALLAVGDTAAPSASSVSTVD